MRRAVGIVLGLGLALLGQVRPADAKGVDIINGVGLIDYSHRPRFQVGSWVRYHVTGTGSTGEFDDYTVTVAITSEERFWGEDCFWVETWMKPRDGPPRGVATMMSYDIFTDSLPIPRMEYYMRKTIDGIYADGTPNEQVLRRPASTLKKRKAVNDLLNWTADTLGRDTVSVPTGNYSCQKIRYREGRGVTADNSDSTSRTEVYETRILSYSPQIPVTGLALEKMEYLTQRKAWAIGRSTEASKDFNIISKAVGEARLEAFGEGMKPQFLLPERVKSLKQIDAEEARARAPARPASNTTAKKKS